MRLKNVVTTLLVFIALSIFVPAVHAQRTISIPTTYNVPAGLTSTVVVSTSTAGSATPLNIVTSAKMFYGLDVNAGANTAGVQVWANFFGVAAASVTPGTTAPIFSVPLQGGGTSNVTKDKTIIPLGSPLGYPIATAMSFNCTLTKNGTTGTQVPCNANVSYK